MSSVYQWGESSSDNNSLQNIMQGPDYIAPKCVIGLDRDGVINVDRKTYTWKSTDFYPIPGSLEAITKLRKLGYKIAVITNQGGIEKGLFTPQDVDILHQHMLDLLGNAGCPSIDAIYYSVSSRKNDEWAKPNTGMFKRCEKEHPHIKFSKGYYVGDNISDLKAAHKIGATPILVRTGYGVETEQELKKFTYRDIRKKTIVFDNLSSFADWVEAN
jgi:D-glycero-D-manno-heptose 1,7-bisphosphate phosphatase